MDSESTLFVRNSHAKRSNRIDVQVPRLQRVAYCNRLLPSGVVLPHDSENIWLAEDRRVTLSRVSFDPSPPPKSTLRWIEEHPAVGTRIGGYVLKEMIGEGGFAEVYRAKQEYPVQREVALKILKIARHARRSGLPQSKVLRIRKRPIHSLGVALRAPAPLHRIQSVLICPPVSFIHSGGIARARRRSHR
jgi:hypothetical protein